MGTPVDGFGQGHCKEFSCGRTFGHACPASGSTKLQMSGHPDIDVCLPVLVWPPFLRPVFHVKPPGGRKDGHSSFDLPPTATIWPSSLRPATHAWMSG